MVLAKLAEKLGSRFGNPEPEPEPESEESSSKDATGTAAYSQSLKGFLSEFHELVDNALEGSITSVDPKGKRRQETNGALAPVFEAFQRRTVQLAETLSETDAEYHRKALKAQATTFKMKMEASRQAAKVQMQSQAAAMAAEYQLQMAAKLEAMGMGSVDAMQEAIDRANDLQDKLNRTRSDLEREVELNRSLKGINRSAQLELDRQGKELREMEMQLHNAQVLKEHEQKDSVKVINNLKNFLDEAANEAERAAMQSAEEAKRQVALLASRLKSLVLSTRSGHPESSDSQLSRLLKELAILSGKLAAKDQEYEKERLQLMQTAEAAIEAARKEAEEAKESYVELSNAKRDDSQYADLKRSLELAHKEAEYHRHRADAEVSKMEDVEKQGASDVGDLEGKLRMSIERLTKTALDVEKAAMQPPEECKRQVESLARRLGVEVATIRHDENMERAQAQLNRVLGEYSDLSKHLAEIELKLVEAEASKAEATDAVETLTERINVLEANDLKHQRALAAAMGELEKTEGANTEFSEQLGRLLAHYRFLRGEAGRMRGTLHHAQDELGITLGDRNDKLSDSLSVLIEQHVAARNEADALRETLDRALAEISLAVGENANLSEKLQQLLLEYKKTNENEIHLRQMLRKAHASLQSAYQRIREVEVELSNTLAASAEQKAALVNASLSALQQLRGRLGAVHGIRPDVQRHELLDATKPVEGALVVRKMAKSRSDATLLQPMMSPVRSKARVDAFMQRVADAAGLVAGFPAVEHMDMLNATSVPPNTPHWSRTLASPSSRGGRPTLSPMSPPRSMGVFTSGGGARVRVPQPGGRDSKLGPAGGLISYDEPDATHQDRGPVRVGTALITATSSLIMGTNPNLNLP